MAGFKQKMHNGGTRTCQAGADVLCDEEGEAASVVQVYLQGYSSARVTQQAEIESE